MEPLTIALLGLFTVGYLVLGGSDIGVGVLLPYLGRSARERRVVIAAIAPFFLGNEVWLVATAGVLAGGFPLLEGELLSGLFPAFVALLVGWVTRDMGLWLRGRVAARGWRHCCDGMITAGSATVALSWGWVFGSTLLGPGVPAALLAVAVAGVFALHGLAFAGLRLTGPPLLRARALFGRMPSGAVFAATAAALAVLAIGVGLQLPLAASAADAATLAFLTPVLAVTTPVVVAAQAVVWWVFRHRVQGPSYL